MRATGAENLGAFFGGFVGAIVGCVFFLVGFIIYGAIKALVFLAAPVRSAFSKTEKMKSVQGGEATKKFRAPRVAADGDEIEDAVQAADAIKVVSVGRQARIHLRFYRDEVQRTVVMLTKQLVAQHGKRVRLDPINMREHDEEFVVQDSIKQAQSIIDGVKKPVKVKAMASVQESASIAPNEPELQPEPEVQNTPEKTRSRKVRNEGVVAYIGTLLSCGVETRTGVRVPYECYCVTIHDENLKSENQLWGTDLERAVQESSVMPGDRIKVAMIGETPVAVAGQSKRKKVWQIEKLSA